MREKKTVLFLCTGNSCRSQMAEGWLRSLAGESIEALSAGIEPRSVHPLAIQVMNEIGVDISGQRSKSVKEYLGRAKIDYAIFVCAKAEKDCPSIYPFALHVLSWPFDDPAAATGTLDERLERFREAREAIRQRIAGWLHRQETVRYLEDITE